MLAPLMFTLKNMASKSLRKTFLDNVNGKRVLERFTSRGGRERIYNYRFFVFCFLLVFSIIPIFINVKNMQNGAMLLEIIAVITLNRGSLDMVK